MKPFGTSLGLRGGRTCDVAFDVGHRAVKAVRRGRSGLESRLVPWSGHIERSGKRGFGDGDPAGRTLSEALAAASATFGLRRGARAACVLSTDYGSLRSVELPSGTDDELLDMVKQEFADLDGGCEIGVWRAPAGDMQSVGAWRLDETLATDVVCEFATAGLECVHLDVPAYAVARCTTQCTSSCFAGPVAVVDCGVSSPSITIVHRGVPRYVRAFPLGCVDEVVRALGDGLGLPVDEAWAFLDEFAGEGSLVASPECRQLVAEYGANAVNALADEVERTIDFVSRRMSALAPCAIVLVGGGASLTLEPLRERYGERVAVWTGSDVPRTGDRAARTPATFAMAASLLDVEVLV